MAKEVKEITINGNRYLIGQHGPDQGDEIFAYLTKALGPVALAFAGNKDAKLMSPEVGKAVSGALSNLSGKDHAEFMRLLLSVCTINGVPAGDCYVTHYAGNHAERYQAAIEVIKHGGFFDIVGAFKGAVAALPSSAQPT